MTDNSPIVLHLKAGDKTFDFFLFSLAVYDNMLYDRDYNPAARTPVPAGTTNEVFNQLQHLFINAPEQASGAIAFSFAQLLVLLSVVDYISKALLDEEAEKLIHYTAHKFPGLAADWVTGYLQNAGQIFEAFRKQFGDLPKVEALLERVTSLNRFQEK